MEAFLSRFSGASYGPFADGASRSLTDMLWRRHECEHLLSESDASRANLTSTGHATPFVPMAMPMGSGHFLPLGKRKAANRRQLARDYIGRVCPTGESRNRPHYIFTGMPTLGRIGKAWGELSGRVVGSQFEITGRLENGEGDRRNSNETQRRKDIGAQNSKRASRAQIQPLCPVSLGKNGSIGENVRRSPSAESRSTEKQSER